MPTEYAADARQLVQANARVLCYTVKNGAIGVIDQLNGDKALIKGAHTGRVFDLQLHPSGVPTAASAIAAEAERAQREASGIFAAFILFSGSTRARVYSFMYVPVFSTF